MKSKRTKSILFVLVFLVTICIISTTSIINVLNNREKFISNIKNTEENNWRMNTQVYLNKIQNELLNQSNKSLYENNDEIKNWLTHNNELNSLDGSIKIESIQYSINEESEFKLKEKLHSKYTQEFNDQILNEYYNIIDSNVTSISDLSILIEKSAYKLYEISNYKVTYDEIKNLLNSTIIKSETVLFSSGEYADLSLSYIDNNDTIKSPKNNDELWVESILIPDGVLGFMDEPQYVNGHENTKFKKIKIIVIKNSNDNTASIINTYKNYNLTNVTLITMTIIIVVCVIGVIIIFINLLKHNRLKGGR